MASKKSGFTLVEVMISLAIVSLVMVSLLGLQITMTKAAARATRKLNMLREAKNFLLESEIKITLTGNKKFSKEVTDSGMELAFERKSLGKGSFLSGSGYDPDSNIGALYLNKVNILKGGGNTPRDSLVKISYVPEGFKNNKTERK